MCVKFPSRDLNPKPKPYPPYFTCRVNIVLEMCSDNLYVIF